MKDKHKGGNKRYLRLAAMIGLSFISMYVLMYAMVDSFANVYPNVNQFYMAGLMAAPMGIIELMLMRHMYMNRKLNVLIIAGGFVVMVVFFVLIRQQTAVSDKQFLKSMIPHHGSAILMCKQSSVQNLSIKDLCKNIISSQQSEIDQMKDLIRELKATQ